MRKLIDLDTAINAIEKESQVDGAYGYMDTKSIVDLLNSLSPVQPEIIRCRDCKYNTGDYKCLNPDSFFLVPADDDFCSYAERREE